jgi:hypothetical protein
LPDDGREELPYCVYIVLTILGDAYASVSPVRIGDVHVDELSI